MECIFLGHNHTAKPASIVRHIALVKWIASTFSHWFFFLQFLKRSDYIKTFHDKTGCIKYFSVETLCVMSHLWSSSNTLWQYLWSLISQLVWRGILLKVTGKKKRKWCEDYNVSVIAHRTLFKIQAVAIESVVKQIALSQQFTRYLLAIYFPLCSVIVCYGREQNTIQLWLHNVSLSNAQHFIWAPITVTNNLCFYQISARDLTSVRRGFVKFICSTDVIVLIIMTTINSP